MCDGGGEWNPPNQVEGGNQGELKSTINAEIMIDTITAKNIGRHWFPSLLEPMSIISGNCRGLGNLQ